MRLLSRRRWKGGSWQPTEGPSLLSLSREPNDVRLYKFFVPLCSRAYPPFLFIFQFIQPALTPSLNRLRRDVISAFRLTLGGLLAFFVATRSFFGNERLTNSYALS